MHDCVELLLQPVHTIDRLVPSKALTMYGGIGWCHDYARYRHIWLSNPCDGASKERQARSMNIPAFSLEERRGNTADIHI